MDDSNLADFIENNLLPALNKRPTSKRDLSFWINLLRNKGMVGSHQWRNLGQIIISGCLLTGLNYRNYLDYCARRGNFRLTY
jgi:hypothetical protein